MAVSKRTVAEPQKLTFDDAVTALHVRIVGGTVNVVGTDEPGAGWRSPPSRGRRSRSPTRTAA
ncbi:hypothetical protein SMICM304S_01053 [Streptomyces microflavus]